jgi:hypothetical protein
MADWWWVVDNEVIEGKHRSHTLRNERACIVRSLLVILPHLDCKSLSFGIIRCNKTLSLPTFFALFPRFVHCIFPKSVRFSMPAGFTLIPNGISYQFVASFHPSSVSTTLFSFFREFLGGAIRFIDGHRGYYRRDSTQGKTREGLVRPGFLSELC